MLVELNTHTVISENNKQNLPHLINSKAKRANKKKEKAERCRQKKRILAQIAAGGGDALLSPIVSTCPPLSSPVMSCGGTLLSPVTGAGYFFSLITCGSLLSTISGGLLSVFFCCFLSLIYYW